MSVIVAGRGASRRGERRAGSGGGRQAGTDAEMMARVIAGEGIVVERSAMLRFSTMLITAIHFI